MLTDKSAGTQGYFKNISDDQGWSNILLKLKDFMDKISEMYNQLEEVYISRSQGSSTLSGDTSYVDTYLRNRCLNSSGYSRFVSFYEEDKGVSLLRDVHQHYDHLHLRFNAVNSKNGRPVLTPYQSIESDLTYFWFELKEDSEFGKKLFLSERKKLPNGEMVLWRFQNFDSFTAFDRETQYGRFPFPTTAIKETSIIDTATIRQNIKSKFLFLTFTKGKNCLDVKVGISIDDKRIGHRWSYDESGTEYHEISQ